MELSAGVEQQLLVFQRNEITEYHIYKRLAKAIKSPENSRILDQIAEDELKHYNLWKAYTQQEVKPSRFGMWFYYLISRLFGVLWETATPFSKASMRACLVFFLSAFLAWRGIWPSCVPGWSAGLDRKGWRAWLSWRCWG